MLLYNNWDHWYNFCMHYVLHTLCIAVGFIQEGVEKNGEDLTQDVIENKICPAILEHKNGKFGKIFTSHTFALTGKCCDIKIETFFS